MSLHQKRKKLEAIFLKKDVRKSFVGDWDTTKRLIVDWWDSYKKWEEKDTINAAYWNSRLAVRYSKRDFDKGVLPMQAASGVGGPSRDFNGFTLDVSMKGIQERMNYENFFSEVTNGTTRKYELGLHDLNASIMKPGKPISKQVYIGENSPSWLSGAYFVFIGLSQEQDQNLFALLNYCAKEFKGANPELHKFVRLIRSGMTRVKLACEHDIGSSFTAIDPDNPVNPKFRYWGKTTKMPKGETGKELATSVENSPGIIHQRKMNAISFKKILNDRFQYNEIVIAYRSHGNPSFPVFSKYDMANNRYSCFKLSPEGGVGQKCGFIPDTPIKTPNMVMDDRD